jgi:hypothetical protein
VQVLCDHNLSYFNEPTKIHEVFLEVFISFWVLNHKFKSAASIVRLKLDQDIVQPAYRTIKQEAMNVGAN